MADSLATFHAEVDSLAVTLEAFNQGFINKDDLKVLTSINPEVSVLERRRALLKHVQMRLEEKLLVFYKHSSELEIEASAVQALKEGLIEVDICNHLKSLQHSNVPFSMRCRYLLQFVCQTLQNFMECMSKVAHVDELKFAEDAKRNNLIDKSVLDYLISIRPKTLQLTQAAYTHLRKQESELKSLAKDVLSLMNPSNIVPRVTDSLIDPQKLSELNELLVNYAYSWKNIGIALKFQPQDLQNIQASPLLINDAPKSYLTRLLEDWLLRRLKHTLPPSVDSLKRALNSQTVGLGSIAREVNDTFCKGTFQTALNPSYCLINVESSFLKPYAVYVEEGKSTLLEIQIAPCEEERKFQWLKDGVELSQDGSKKPIFCLHQADIDWDGCELSCRVETAEPTIAVNVSCELDHFRSNLASMYLAQPKVPEDTWPPVADLKFINLALVKQQKVDYNSEYARLTIRGDLDDVLQDKQIIAYNDKDFFKNMSSGKMILIEGRPGSGKTTFVHKLAQDWAIKSGGAIRLLLLVSLRVLNTFANPDLSDILTLFENLKVSKDIIEQRLGKGVCFIFDGFDELSPQNEKSSVIHKIISKTYLCNSIVIVASRPAAIAKLRHKANIVIEVVGFLNKQILEYFDHYPFSTSTKSVELKLYLESHPNILHICYLPIHATMVAFLFQEMGKVPKTETEIYTHFTRFTLIRNLTKNREFEPVGLDLHTLTGEEGLCFRQICLLAFEITLSSKQVLDQNEVSSHFQTKRNIDSSLGLITVDRTAGLYGYKNIYTFMHLTFQEYLAAYHITTLSDEEQMKLIQEHGDKNHMLVVWKFYCGLTKIKVFDNKFKSILCKTEGNTLFQIQCGYETQQKITCAQLLKSVAYHFKLEDKYLSTPDFTALGYVTNTTVKPTKLSLLKCNINVEAIDALLSEMEDRARDSLHDLHIVTAAYDNSQMECMKKLLANLKSLKVVSLEAKMTETTSSTEVSSNVLPDLTDLSLSNIDIRPLLSYTSFNKLINLCFKGSGSLFKSFVFDYLRHCKFLKELDVSGFCNIDHPDAANLVRSLRNFHTVEKISLTKIGMMETADIQKQDLHNNRSGTDIIDTLSVHFMKYSSLKELRIDSSLIGDHGIKTFFLSSNLQHCSNMLILSLPHNNISSNGCWVLAANLHHCTNLEKLDLEDNNIYNDGAYAIILSLNSCKHFQELNLLRNPCYSIKEVMDVTFTVIVDMASVA